MRRCSREQIIWRRLPEIRPVSGGTLVSALIAGQVSDVDTGALAASRSPRSTTPTAAGSTPRTGVHRGARSAARPVSTARLLAADASLTFVSCRLPTSMARSAMASSFAHGTRPVAARAARRTRAVNGVSDRLQQCDGQRSHHGDGGERRARQSVPAAQIGNEDTNLVFSSRAATRSRSRTSTRGRIDGAGHPDWHQRARSRCASLPG